MVFIKEIIDLAVDPEESFFPQSFKFYGLYFTYVMNSRVPFSMQPGLGLSFIFVCLWVPNCTSNTGCKPGSPSSDCFYASVKDRLEIVTSICFQALCSSESICVMGHTVLMTPALEEVFRSGGMISFALFFLNVARVIFSLHMCILKVLLEFSTNKKR